MRTRRGSWSDSPQYAKYFESKLGVPVKYLPVKSYPAAVTAFTNNPSAVRLVRRFDGRAGAACRAGLAGDRAGRGGRGIQELHHRPRLDGAQASPRTSRKTSQGKTFTFGARASTSGRLFPEHFIRQALGKEPEKVFSRVGYSGDHSRTIQLVQSGAYQVGVLNHLVWDQEVKSGKVDTKTVAVIWETPTYPDYHWVARGDIDKTFGAGFTARLQAAILGVDDPKLLAIFDRTKFIPAKNDDYKVDRGGRQAHRAHQLASELRAGIAA